MKRFVVCVTAATALLLLLAGPGADARYRGSDMFNNVAPAQQDVGPIAGRYPLSDYSLDYHVDAGLTNAGGIPPLIAQFLSGLIWTVTTWFVAAVLVLFRWAFSLDLINGPHGALPVVSDVVDNLHQHVIGEAWLIAVIIAAGLWGVWKGLTQRRYAETFGGLAVSIGCVVTALFLITHPISTVGQASKLTNDVSVSMLSAVNRGTLNDPHGTRRDISDALFQTLIVQPWAVLEFGGTRTCADWGRLDDDKFPKPISDPNPPPGVPQPVGPITCRSVLHVDRSGHGGYAERFLKQDPGSDERKAEYEALKNGEAPDDPQFRGAKIDKGDAGAVDPQQAEGAYQRLAMTTGVAFGALGGGVLIGWLSLAVVLSQVFALVLLAFGPVMLLAGAFPGKGHAMFFGWLKKGAAVISLKALFSLGLAIAVALALALEDATGTIGFLASFGLTAAFFWGMFFYRRKLASSMTGESPSDFKSFQRREQRHHAVSVARRTARRAFVAPLSTVARTGTRNAGAARRSYKEHMAGVRAAASSATSGSTPPRGPGGSTAASASRNGSGSNGAGAVPAPAGLREATGSSDATGGSSWTREPGGAYVFNTAGGTARGRHHAPTPPSEPPAAPPADRLGERVHREAQRAERASERSWHDASPREVFGDVVSRARSARRPRSAPVAKPEGRRRFRGR